MYTIPRKILEKKQSINLCIETHAKAEKSTSAIQYYTQVILVGLTDVHGYNIISTKKRVYKGERRPTKFRKTFSTNLALKQEQPEEIDMEVDEQPTLSVNEQIEAAAASGAAAAAADEAAYNLRPRPRLPDADDAAFLLASRSNTIIHAMELLQEPPSQSYPQSRSAFTCVREIIVDKPAEPAQPEEDIDVEDVEVEIIAERIISDWRQLHQNLMHTSPASPDERRKEEEEPTQGPALPPIRMKKRSAYTTDKEVEEIMKNQASWDIVDPQPAEKKLRRHQEGPFEVEDSLPGHLKELRRTLTRLRETAKQARRNLDQVRRLAYDADLIQIGIQQLVGERMLESDSD